MTYIVLLKSPHKEMVRCFSKEKFAGKRSRVNITEDDNHALFTVEADDSVALRATLNAITKLFTVYEKARGI